LSGARSFSFNINYLRGVLKTEISMDEKTRIS
jgi:hypothetical protein